MQRAVRSRRSWQDYHYYFLRLSESINNSLIYDKFNMIFCYLSLKLNYCIYRQNKYKMERFVKNRVETNIIQHE